MAMNLGHNGAEARPGRWPPENEGGVFGKDFKDTEAPLGDIIQASGGIRTVSKWRRQTSQFHGCPCKGKLWCQGEEVSQYFIGDLEHEALILEVRTWENGD